MMIFVVISDTSLTLLGEQTTPNGDLWGSVVLFPTGITLLGEQTSRNRNPPPVRDDATGSLSNGDFFGGLSFALPRGLPRVPCAYRLAVSRGFRAPSASRFPAVFDLSIS